MRTSGLGLAWSTLSATLPSNFRPAARRHDYGRRVRLVRGKRDLRRLLAYANNG
jgi:hypothetical protein